MVMTDELMWKKLKLATETNVVCEKKLLDG